MRSWRFGSQLVLLSAGYGYNPATCRRDFIELMTTARACRRAIHIGGAPAAFLGLFETQPIHEEPMQIRIASVMVENQETALRFYTSILGFVKNKTYQWVNTVG